MHQLDSLSDAQVEFLRRSLTSQQECGNTSFELRRWGGQWSVTGRPHGDCFEGPGMSEGTPQADFTFFQQLEEMGLISLERLTGRAWKYTLTDDAGKLPGVS